MSQNYKILGNYHTSLRNVGLFTSVSFAALAYSRYYRSKNDDIYNIGLILVSVAFIIVSIMISNFLISDFENDIGNIKDNKKYSIRTIKKWLTIPYFVLGIEYVILVFGLFTLYREYNRA